MLKRNPYIVLKSSTKKYAELALVMAIPTFVIDDLKPSRQKGLFQKLEKVAHKETKKLFRIPPDQMREIQGKIYQFGQDSGWWGDVKHVGTMLSFAADMLERSEHDHNPKLIEIINELVGMFEFKKDLKPASCWGGAVAADKWDAVFK
jgi:hypothetical protein